MSSRSFCVDVFSAPLDKYSGVKFLGHGKSMFNHLRSCQTIFQSDCSVLDPISRDEGSSFSTSWPALVTDFVIITTILADVRWFSLWLSFRLRMSSLFSCFVAAIGLSSLERISSNFLPM
uniref:Uncharacterized protein n=1 Tax=Sus scrofa TaxID=9823 RepID=A0A4X1TEB3_PIG